MKKFPLFMAITAMILTLSITVFPISSFAAIPDGTYELKYEMKEAKKENTSMADGYFTKPAKLIVKNGVQTIQVTLTGSNYIDSLSAPSGPVEIVSENKEKNIRVVKFRVDGDLSKPLPMEMHIIVPDLYDMVHTARAVFDTSGLNKAASVDQPVKEEAKIDPPKTEAKPAEKDKKSESVETSKNTEEEKNHEVAEDSSNQEDEKIDETEEAVEDEKVELEDSNSEVEEEVNPIEDEIASTNETTETKVEDVKEERGSTLPFWIASLVFIVGIAGFIFWKQRNKNNYMMDKGEKEK